MLRQSLLLLSIYMLSISFLNGRTIGKGYEFNFYQWKVIVSDNIYFMSGDKRVASLGIYGFKVTSSELKGNTVLAYGKKGKVDVKLYASFNEGKLKVAYQSLGTPEEKETKRLMCMLTLSGGSLANTIVLMDERPILIPDKFIKHEFKHASNFVFFENNPLEKFKAQMIDCEFANLRDFRQKDSGRNDFQLFALSSKNNRIELEIDLSIGARYNVRNSYPGEKYISYDNLHLPDLSKSKNLVQNPGFEGGFVLWGSGVTDVHKAPNRENGWMLDKTVAHTGKKSARYTVAKGYNAPMLCTWPIAVETGTKYTVSFYAKTDHEGEYLSVFIHTAKWGEFPAKAGKRIKLTKDWQRFEISFNAPNPFLRICFGDRWWDKGANNGTHIWLDNVQLETGEKATEFTQKPIFAFSKTSTQDECFSVNEKEKNLSVNVVNASDHERECKINVFIQDVYRKNILKKQFHASLGPWEELSKTIDLSSINRRGILRVVMDAETVDFQERFYGRVLIYEKIPDPGKMRFGWHLDPSVSEAKYLERFGIYGSLSCQIPENPSLCKKLADINWLHIFTAAISRKSPVKVFHQKMTENDWEAYSKWLEKRTRPYKDQIYWKTYNEPNCGGYVWTPADCAKATQIYRNHIKAINPKAKILSPDPYSASRAGRNWMDLFFASGGDKLIDALAIHTYRARPEAPDLDSDIQELKKLMEKHKLKDCPIMFTEGEGSPIYSIPEIGMSPFRGFFEWRLGLLSMDIGKSELAAAALMTRTLLACLKNSDIVKFYLSWRNDIIQKQPKASLAAINWLLALLRNADFLREKVIGNNVRTYIFSTQDKEPVIVLWSYDLKVDRGEKQPEKATMKIPGKGWKLFDFMGNRIAPCEINGRWQFQVSGYPVYLVGPKGSEAKLTSLLEDAAIVGAEAHNVYMKLRITDKSAAKLIVSNLQTVPIAGKIKVDIDGKCYEKTISLPGKETEDISIKLPEFAYGIINESKIGAIYTGNNGKETRFEEKIRWFAVMPLKRKIKIDGLSDDWKNFPAIVLRSSDLTAKVRLAYKREEGLYFCIQVRDNAFIQASSIGNCSKADSIQIFIDLMADGRDQKGAGYDSNDQSFCIAKITGKDLLYRDYTPEWQIAFVKQGLIKNSECVIQRSKNTTTYEFKLPLKEIFPMKMQSGNSFGFGIIVNDSDGIGKTRHFVANTPFGENPYERPELWPTAILTD